MSIKAGAEHAALEALVAEYFGALNAGKANSVLPLYAEDGVLMAPMMPPARGSDALSAAYEGLLQIVRFNMNYQVEEVQQLGPDWAFVRTSSSGQTTISGASQAAAYLELFLLKKGENHKWRIARYITTPQAVA